MAAFGVFVIVVNKNASNRRMDVQRLTCFGDLVLKNVRTSVMKKQGYSSNFLFAIVGFHCMMREANHDALGISGIGHCQ